MRKKIIAGVITALILLSLFLGFQLKYAKEEPPVITAELLNNRLENVSNLVTTEYYYTNMGKFENQNNFYGWKVPFTKKQFILSYDGKITAGIIGDDLLSEVEENKVTLTVPKAEIMTHEIFYDTITVFDEQNTLFNPIKLEDYNGFYENQRVVMEEKAIASGLLDGANDRTKEIVNDLIEFIKGLNPEVEIVVKYIGED